MATLYRQGHVVFVEIGEVPPEAKRRLSDVLEISGETGKVHRVEGVSIYDVPWDRGPVVEVMDRPVVVTHPQHPFLELPPRTTWEVREAREYTPVAPRLVD